MRSTVTWHYNMIGWSLGCKMQLVEEELFRDLLTTGVIVLVNNLINILYHTTQFFFSLTCWINVNTDNFALSTQLWQNRKIFRLEVACQRLGIIVKKRKFDILMSSSYSRHRILDFVALYFQSKNKYLQDGRLKLTPTICNFLAHLSLMMKPKWQQISLLFFLVKRDSDPYAPTRHLSA